MYRKEILYIIINEDTTDYSSNNKKQVIFKFISYISELKEIEQLSVLNLLFGAMSGIRFGTIDEMNDLVLKYSRLLNKEELNLGKELNYSPVDYKNIFVTIDKNIIRNLFNFYKRLQESDKVEFIYNLVKSIVNTSILKNNKILVQLNTLNKQCRNILYNLGISYT